MISEPKIPFGYKQVPATETMRRYDGVWSGDKFKPARKVGKEWAVVGQLTVIRRCVVEQTPLTFEEVGRIMDLVEKKNL